MENQLPLIVKIEVKEGKIAQGKTELLKLLDITRKEDGCVLYQLHDDLENPNTFTFYEIWETEEKWITQ